MRVTLFTTLVVSLVMSSGPVPAREWVEFTSAVNPPTRGCVPDLCEFLR